MKRTSVILLLLVCGLLPLHGAVTGYVYLGGGYDRSRSNEIDGTEVIDDSGYAEATVSLTYQREQGFWSLFGYVNRDDFYYEKSGRLSYGQYDTFMGNVSAYVSYSDLDDITESDNDNGRLSAYVQSVKYVTDEVYMGFDAAWDHVDYRDEAAGLYDYDDLSVSANAGLGDLYVNLKGTDRSIADGETPGYFEYSADVYGYFYPGDAIINVSAGADIKNYAFTTADYDDYSQKDVSLKLGHKLGESFVPYISGEYSMYDEKDNPGDYRQWEAGLEIEMFRYPLSISVRTGRKDFDEESENRLSYGLYKLEGYWNFWAGPLSLYLGDNWELQKIDDVTATEFPEAKNSNFINDVYAEVSLDISRTLSFGVDLSYQWREFFIEDEMNANYTQFVTGIEIDYNLFFRYVWNIKAEVADTRYETYTENDGKKYSLKSMLQYSF